LDLV
jgi:prevent-host-death family protein